jgi:hypothetical protein
MGKIVSATESKPSTPASGNGTAYFNSTTKKLAFIDDAGLHQSLSLGNFSTTSQAPAATTRTYITGSNIAFPAGALQVGTKLRWVISLTKTGAGTATSTIDIAFGTAGTTADTARVSFTKPAGTAAADEGTITIEAIVRSIGASGVVVGQFNMIHNLSATGHMVIPCACVNTVSAGFDMTTVTNVGICITSGASDAVTIQLVTAEAFNL